MLGPPRRSFASSTARTNGKSGEGEDALKDSERSRLGDRFSERRANGRFSRDGETDDRYARRRDEEGEGRPRRPKWAQEEGEEARPRTSKKFEQPWFRSERGGEALEDAGRDGDREWRRGGGRERTWGRETPADTDPEWLDNDDDTPAPTRTQDDLQRWLQAQKDKNLGRGPGAEETVASPTSALPSATETKSTLPQFFDAEADDSMDKFFTRLTDQKPTPSQQQTSAKPHGKSRFGALFGPSPLDTQKAASPDPMPQQMSAPPMRQQSAGPDPIQQMFNLPMREKHAPSPAVAAAADPKSASAADPDQAGFARILEMLQGRSKDTPSPQAQEPKPKVPLYARDSQNMTDSPKEASLLGIFGTQSHQPPPRPPPSRDGPKADALGARSPVHQQRSNDPQNMRPAGPDRHESSHSPQEGAHSRQSGSKNESLLDLLKQAGRAPKPTPGPEQFGPRGMSGDMMHRPPPPGHHPMGSPTAMGDPMMLHRRENGRSEELPQMRYSEDHLRYEQMIRRQNSDNPRAMYDEQLLETLRSGGRDGPRPSHSHGPPPGLGRPPGFDQMPPRMPPPGWGGPPPPHQQPSMHHQQGPPPSGRPNIPPGYGMPPPPQQGRDQRGPPPPQGGPQQPQRKYTGESGTMMGPPPGFGGSNGPPPGLLGMFGGGPPPPPQQQRYPPMQSPPEQGPGRQFMDMYSDMPGGPPPPQGRNGVRGVGGPLGGYR